MEEKKEWYVVNTYAGKEQRVKENIETRVKNENLQDFVFQIIVAEEEEIDVKNGKEVVKTKNLFPGYIFVEMIMTDEIWFKIRNTPGVTGFIGSSGGGVKPFAVKPNEMESVLRRIGQANTKIVVDFKVGDQVTILSGPFAKVTGTVESMDDGTAKAKILVIVFGKETPTEIDYINLKKADDQNK